MSNRRFKGLVIKRGVAPLTLLTNNSGAIHLDGNEKLKLRTEIAEDLFDLVDRKKHPGKFVLHINSFKQVTRRLSNKVKSLLQLIFTCFLLL